MSSGCSDVCDADLNFSLEDYWNIFHECFLEEDGTTSLNEEVLNSGCDGSFSVSPIVPTQEILKYAKLIENGINSHCPEELREALETCCTDNLIYLVHYPKLNTYGYSYRHVAGRNAVANYLHMNYSTCPDILFLVHSQELVVDTHGHKTVKCKFTINGTGLFDVQFVNNGDQLPRHPLAKHTHDKIKYLLLMKKQNNDGIKQEKKSPENEVEQKEKEELYDLQHNVTFKKKDDNISKFNRYKAGDTVGAYVEYDAFTEGNIKNNKKKLSDVVSQEEHCDTDQKQDAQVSRSLSDAQRVALYAAEVAGRYTDTQKFYGDERSTYIVSEMFALPVPVNAKGIMTLHIDKQNKVCMIENMLSVKPL